MTRLAAEALCIRRGGRAILDRVSVAAGQGEFIALVGNNGAGKSTLLAALAGLIAPDAGSVLLDGRAISSHGLATLARRRAYLPQSPRCEWPIPVERLIALGLTPVLPAFGGLADSQRARVDETIAALDLEEQRDQAATTLSGGELARAMLARALVGDPDILLIDEPVSGLDPRHTIDTLRRLRALTLGGKLVIASLHDLTLAARFSTRIVALKHGRLVADGATAEVLTGAMVHEVFDVVARVSGQGDTALVDFV
jgi:iron complex transport system ATP-binding protein